MTRTLFFTLLSISFVINGYSQDSDALLLKLSERAKTFENIEATYSSKMVDLKNDFEETMSGKIYIEGDKFNLNLGEFVIISDGITVWTYEPESNDCYIDDADMLIDEGMDPSRIFTIWEDEFNSEWKGREMVGDRDCVQINLYPIDGDEKPYHTLKMYIDDVKLEIVRLVVKGREGMDTDYLIERFNTGVTLPNSSFDFDESKYPGALMIDNRI
ncbi:MAG TPA: outer membrane lipoprotein carrier protein LolA [Flavobacteriales bacterium]|nr:outer membrane lipoprotein carrier protein LolA [Flavobacteriales bacterium]HHZ97732.1 outer membrane lipoprotein carrier protein LolA [Flavobacteriales bacterium]HIB77932.1 outer membrane lipoprotein carrier protein LolA [Flavobacteriales bacterium]HIO15626.1 outer membrane lipoprotein carrier protein LolA [Flavobacteriales bacterium]HIO58596.1 outer membrane lipoprotein carrier protein LolA [Flavobacteriales bacterium]